VLEAEADGLRALAGAAALRVPDVLAVGVAGSQAFLALEWLELRTATSRVEARLGEQLARQHRVTAPSFGCIATTRSAHLRSRTPGPTTGRGSLPSGGSGAIEPRGRARPLGSVHRPRRDLCNGWMIVTRPSSRAVAAAR